MQNKKLWIAFGVVAALCLCLGVGGFFALGQLGNKFMESVKTDEEAAQVGAKIAQYSLPAGYEHLMAMSIMGFDYVIIAPQGDATNGAIIMLAQFDEAYMQNSDPQSFQEQMQRSMEQQSGRRGMKMELVETRTMTIRGQQVEVLILEGTDENGTSMRQLITNFNTESGLGMVMIQGLTEEWDQAVVDQFLKSIH
ncbi:MAG: hypothetical protein ACOY0R_08305 [Chloroflexota bacterium]